MGDAVKTTGISDDKASSPGGYYDNCNTDPYTRSDEPASRDVVRTHSFSSNMVSSLGDERSDAS